PEVVKNEPYGEKADIWALGCILYQMAALRPPFYSSNMLSLASKIVEGVYEPVEEETFSERVTDMIRWCLSPDVERRPDIVAVTSRISDLMMRLMDGLYASQNALEKRAVRDRKRAQKYFLERHRTGTDYFHSDVTLVKLRLFLFIPLSLALVSAGICVSQKKLRQIDDPIQRLLVQLHKIIYITQLPPDPHHNVKRRLVERFKKSLFHFGSDPCNLKVELSKVCTVRTQKWNQGSPSTHTVCSSQMHINMGYFTPQLLQASPELMDDGVTYQQMQVSFKTDTKKNSVPTNCVN
uniref:Protein kinase domain-containing protein n=1 Tax=Salarias fasciatus TaxID=181472 RepID=A0A672G0T0_SALFA